MRPARIERCTCYIGNVEFTDDPRMTPVYRDREDILRGGSGVTTPSRDSMGAYSPCASTR